MANTQKTAIVTGASQGIGAGLVEAFLKRGYGVVANSRNITKTNPFAAPANLALVDGDIGDPKTAAEITEAAVSRFGWIDVLINNAGILKPFHDARPKLAGFLCTGHRVCQGRYSCKHSCGGCNQYPDAQTRDP